MDLNAFIDQPNILEDPEPMNRRVVIPEDELADRLKFYEANTEGFIATDEHLDAMISIFNGHRNVFVTGRAGTGKTTFIRNVVIPEMDFRNLQWSVTATTGIAGSHLEGKTIHSFFGIGLGPEWKMFYPKELMRWLEGVRVGADVPNPQDMSDAEREAWYSLAYDLWLRDPKIKPFMRDGVMRRLRGHEALLIDEISMCCGDGLFGYLEFMLRQIRGNDKPFGGMQLIVIGDFAQLPPVEERDDFSRPDWAFLSSAWARAKMHPVMLTRMFRQDNPRFMDFLNNVREGNITPDDRQYAQRFVRNDMTQEEVRMYPFLVPTNEEAKRLNSRALTYYEGPTLPLEAEVCFEPAIQNVKDWERRQPYKVHDALVKSMRLVEDTTFVRIGYPVMLTVNDSEGRFVNGTRGFVREVCIEDRSPACPEDMDYVIVGVPNVLDPTQPEGLVKVYRHTYSRDREQDPREMVDVPQGFNQENDTCLPEEITKWPTIRQFPIMPATAITIHKCVDKSTLIPTESGIIEMESICNSGSMPRVHGENGLRESTEPFIGQVEKGYRVTTRRGFSIVCSERHPLKRAGESAFEWVKAPDLKVGDVIRMRGNTQSFGSGELPSDVATPQDYHSHGAYRLPSSVTPDLAWMLGALTGDGCQSDERDGRIDITSMDWEVLNKFADVMKSEFGLEATLKPKPTSKARVSYVHNWGVRRWLLQLGLSHATAVDKRIPRCIFQGSKEQQVAFLRGYFDADGGVNTAVHVTSSSVQLIREVHLLLLNLGIVGTVATMEHGRRINITGVDITKFRDIVGFSIPRKMKACEGRSPSHRKVPKVECGFYPAAFGRGLAVTIREELRSVYPHSRGLGFGDMQHWAWFLSRTARGNCRLSDAHLAAMQRDLPLCKDASPLCAAVFGDAASGCFLDEIVSIEEVEGEMRDICVPDGHAFVGNGFVNHNSQGLSLECAILALSRSFAAGQVYVGLSRLRDPKGLVLAEADFEAKVDPDVMEYYRMIDAMKLMAS